MSNITFKSVSVKTPDMNDNIVGELAGEPVCLPHVNITNMT